jgi:hypothetical protein
MGGKDLKYQIIYRGETLAYVIPGQWVFFQRSKESGGGYWLGRTYPDFYLFGLERPVSLSEGLQYMILGDRVEANSKTFDDDFELYG